MNKFKQIILALLALFAYCMYDDHDMVTGAMRGLQGTESEGYDYGQLKDQLMDTEKESVIYRDAHSHSQQQPSSPTPILILITEGGCSETTAISDFMARIIKAHGIYIMSDVRKGVRPDEFLAGNKVNRNPYYTKMVIDRGLDIAKQRHGNYTNMIIESIQLAQRDVKKFNGVMFFKLNKALYRVFKARLDKEIDGISYRGLYRENILDRCICMVKDCFEGMKAYGRPVFASNGTETNLCFGRRDFPEYNIQARFHDIKGCLEADKAAVDFVKNKPYDSFAAESLTEFEYSGNNEVFEASIDQWMGLMEPLIKDKLDRSVVAGVLRQVQDTRKLKSQESAVYDYGKMRDEIAVSEKWSVHLRD